MTATEPTAADLLRTLSPEAKEELLIGLLREFLDINSDLNTVAVYSPSEEWLGNFVRPGEPAAAADRVFASLVPQMRHAIMQPYLDLDLDNVLSDEEVEAITAGATPTRR